MGFWWIAYGMKEREGSRMTPKFLYIWHFNRSYTWLSEGDWKCLSPNMELRSEYSNPVVGRIGKNQKTPQFKHHQTIRVPYQDSMSGSSEQGSDSETKQGPKGINRSPILQMGIQNHIWICHNRNCLLFNDDSHSVNLFQEPLIMA